MDCHRVNFRSTVGSNFCCWHTRSRFGRSIWSFYGNYGCSDLEKGFNREYIANKMKNVVKFETQTQRIVTALILGFAVGLMTGVLGAGGGGMILLILIFVLNFPLHVAIGTSALIMAITACSGTFGYALHGNVRPLAGLILGFSAAGSGMVSARFANRVNEQILAKAVGIIFIILGTIMTILHLA